jgi:hypothetical protein
MSPHQKQPTGYPHHGSRDAELASIARELHSGGCPSAEVGICTCGRRTTERADSKGDSDE